MGTSSRRRPLRPMPRTRTSSTTTGRSGMTKPNSLMYLRIHRPRETDQRQAARPPAGLPGRRAAIPLHEGGPKVASPGRAGRGRVLVGRHHEGTVCALVAQVQEALGADLGPAAAGRVGQSHLGPGRPACLLHARLASPPGPRHLGRGASKPAGAGGGGWEAVSAPPGRAPPPLPTPPGKALGPQGVHTLLLQAAQPLVQLHEGLGCVGQGTRLLRLVDHVGQGQPQCGQQPAVPVRTGASAVWGCLPKPAPHPDRCTAPRHTCECAQCPCPGLGRWHTRAARQLPRSKPARGPRGRGLLPAKPEGVGGAPCPVCPPTKSLTLMRPPEWQVWGGGQGWQTGADEGEDKGQRTCVSARMGRHMASLATRTNPMATSSRLSREAGQGPLVRKLLTSVATDSRAFREASEDSGWSSPGPKMQGKEAGSRRPRTRLASVTVTGPPGRCARCGGWGLKMGSRTGQQGQSGMKGGAGRAGQHGKGPGGGGHIPVLTFAVAGGAGMGSCGLRPHHKEARPWDREGRT